MVTIQKPRIEMYLQRANARCHVENSGQIAFFNTVLQPGHQGMCAKMQCDIEYRFAILDQQIFIPGLSVNHLYLPVICRNPMQYRITRLNQGSRNIGWYASEGIQLLDHLVLLLFQLQRLFRCERVKTHAITRFELTGFP